MNNTPWNDNIVTFLKVKITKHGLKRAISLMDEEDLISHAIFVIKISIFSRT